MRVLVSGKCVRISAYVRVSGKCVRISAYESVIIHVRVYCARLCACVRALVRVFEWGKRLTSKTAKSILTISNRKYGINTTLTFALMMPSSFNTMKICQNREEKNEVNNVKYIRAPLRS